MTGIRQEIRLAVRPLLRRPILVVVISVVIGLGVAVSTVLFGILTALRVAPPGVRSPEQLVYIYSAWSAGTADPVFREFIDVMEARGSGLGEFTSHQPVSVRLSSDGNAISLTGEVVEPNYLDVLGADMYLGRFLSRSPVSSGSPEVVISHRLWRSRFGADPSIVGKFINLSSLNGTDSFAIVGVTAPGFRGLSDPLKPSQIWIGVHDFRGGAPGLPVVRLEPNTDLEEFKTFLATTTRSIQELAKQEGTFFAGSFRLSRSMIDGLRFSAFPARNVQNPTNPSTPLVPTPLLVAILVFIALVEIIVASNLAGLVLSHRAAQARDLAMQKLLGATRSRIVMQRVVEACALGLPGALLGLSGAAVLLGPLRLMSTARIPIDVHFDWATSAFGCLVAVGGVLAVGLLSSTKTADNLISGANVTTTSLRRRVRLAILVPQVAGSAALLSPAGVYLESLIAGNRVGTASNAQTIVLKMTRADAPRPTEVMRGERDRGRAFAVSVLALVRSVPSVEAAGLVDDLPLQPARQEPLRVRGREATAAAVRREVSDDYFRALGLGISLGRGFDSRDDTDQNVIVSRELARRLGIRVGAKLSFDAGEVPSAGEAAWLTVVGVVDDVVPVIGAGTPEPVVYLPADHARASRLAPFFSSAGQMTSMVVQTKVPLDPESLRRILITSVPSAEVWEATSIGTLANQLLLPTRLAGLALGFAGLCALILACCGLAGMISYLIAEQWQEIGIRLAFGADAASLIRLFLGEATIALGAGLLLGSGLAVFIFRFMTRILPEPGAVSLVSYAAGEILVAAAVMAVSWFSARRATACEPAVALRRS